MLSTHPILEPVISKIVNLSTWITFLLIAGIIIKPKKPPITKSRVFGTIRSLQDQLQGSVSEKEKVERNFRKCRSVSEEQAKEIAFLKEQIKNRSLYVHQLERDLLKKRFH